MKGKLGIIVILCVLLLGCDSPEKKKSVKLHKEVELQRDLNAIIEDGKLKAILAYSGTSYFLYKGKPMGFEYELLQKLAEHLKVELELKVSKNLDSLISHLSKGDVDLVAYGLAITAERKKKIAFTDYLYVTKQVLVQKKPKNWRSLTLDQINSQLVQDPLELIGDTVSVRENSSYFKRLLNLSEEMGGDIIIDTLEGKYSTAEIIKMVDEEKIKFTIADKNIADINASYFPYLDTEVPVSFSQRIAWAVRPSSPKLLDTINSWINQGRESYEYRVIYNKYFKNKGSFRSRARSDFYSLNQEQISPYDDIIKDNAERVGMDWRLLAALVYQESRFKNDSNSNKGAAGLMQMMPATAEELGVKNRLDPAENIRAGTNYLQKIYTDFEDIPDSLQRLKFTLAAYNCGYYHLRDAQKLAVSKNMDPLVWDGHVDQMILALSDPVNYNLPEVSHGYVRGMETYNYIIEIFDRFDHYVQFYEEE
ncbi:transglycosylase SLT domain-containing protein [Eudoraea chungangensis]|uniref:transglycosylase SLT domain-containing protein n=1 Tax=Eudoraea chungangensis TaxID=1481905 RepID=UPI0023EE1C7A|nr:transporter substrate-binding domain-containing protein [Eudoraea chungangensis]